ncbi:BKACE family enzyme [Alkalibacter mobilis]|uniref:3-keto-5-aminohexanoate cleavage protein n=1 Tax=Alkalibacter mobilis TaxID=2787712 RepID=UPI0018A0A03E|nr:3-keto-5-aminohexanoate cleavage protein [Alkalibacter mobilis]MBF7095592.1 3-keto-5-aminohexanoate cleavage protein [Alkalibacter mobilis]
MSNLSNKVILTVATTGAWPQKSDTPNIPLQPEEIAEDILDCYNAGASVAHIHVRNDENKASMSFEKFEQTVKLVREKCDIVINLTTSGGIGLSDEVRIKPFYELKPEIASFDCGSMNWQHNTVFENSPSFLEKLGNAMQEVDVKPEIEIFDAGMVYNALYYLKKGVLQAPLHFQFVLGVPGGMAATVENLVYLKSLIPQDCTWGALGIGKMHLPVMYATMALGGHLRVGMEDNIFYAPKVLAESNRQFVERTNRIVAEMGKEIATPQETREILGLENWNVSGHTK